MCVLQDDEAAVVEADGCPVNLRDTREVEVSDQGCRVGKNVLVRLVGQHREVSERDVPVLSHQQYSVAHSPLESAESNVGQPAT
jgi:hypothetical protein